MKVKGYMGRVLYVDLSRRETEARELDEESARMYIGGTGMAAKVLWDNTGAKTDPLGPDNCLCFFTGPCTGTGVPTSGRLGIAGISPLTGIWGESSLGGSWAVELKKAGYDGLVVSGIADEPVYLYIHEGRIEIRAADHLWGMDTWLLDEHLKQETHPKASTLGIGPAGENKVLLASIQADGKLGRSASRCGLGAIMGAKRLKGVAVKGSAKVPVYDAEGLQAWRKQHFSRKPRDTEKIYDRFRMLGERTWEHLFTSKNWLNESFESFKEPWIEELAAKDLVDKNLFLHCNHCSVGCVESFKDESGKRYQTGQHTAKMGATCMIDDMHILQQAYDLCQKLGIDGISLGSALAFAMEASERGLLTAKDSDGLDLSWGNAEAMLELTEKTGKNEGFGSFLGTGVKRMAEALGAEAQEFAVHIKGNEPTLQDFRAWNAGTLENVTCSRGGHHFEGMTLAIQTMDVDFSQWGDFPKDPLAEDGQGRLTAFAQNFGVMVDSLVVCKFLMGATSAGQVNTPSEHALWLSLVTGWKNDFSEFILTGERIFNLKRMINVRRGITAKDDVLPPRLANTKRGWGGMSKDNIPPLKKMLKEYYAVRGWNDNGIPGQERLSLLGLQDQKAETAE